MNARIERLAVALAEAWRNDTTMPLPAADAAPASRAEAYAVQDRMAALIDDAVVGWKVGATVEAVQRLEGHDGPIPGGASQVTDVEGAVRGQRLHLVDYVVECGQLRTRSPDRADSTGPS